MDSFNPYDELEKTKTSFKINYKQLNTYYYFENYFNFLASLAQINYGKDDFGLQEKIDSYIKSLCKMYICHNIHYKVTEEVNKQTKISILKGDYIFSEGFYEVCKIGDPNLIKYYSKSSEVFSKSIFILGLQSKYFILLD